MKKNKNQKKARVIYDSETTAVSSGSQPYQATLEISVASPSEIWDAVVLWCSMFTPIYTYVVMDLWKS